MTIEALIAAASQSKRLSPHEVDAFCARETLTVEAFCDAFARKIAVGYFGGEFTFSFCDNAINALIARPRYECGRLRTSFRITSEETWSVA